ncbi:MAG: peptidyl-prolyl cis-trans isomerase [Myxococcales bacterium]|nr:peptidyl-prolyl cis-trans isomerase [Myxococcales bacterium]
MLALLTLLAAAADGVVDRVAAVVDDEIVLLSDVYDLGGDFVEQSCTRPFDRMRCVYEAETQILDALIKRALIKRELERLQYGVATVDVDQAIDSIVRDYGLADREALRKEVEVSGLTWESYRQQLRDQLQVQRFQQRVLLPRVTVSPDEVKDLYDRTARGQSKDAVVLDALGVVLPPDGSSEAAVAQVDALVAKLRAGEITFAEARELYDAAGLGAAIGDRVYERGKLAPQLDAVVFDAPVDEVLPPVRLGNVLMVVRVREKTSVEGDVKPFEEVKDGLEQQVMMQRVEEAENEWYQRMRREVSVKVLLPEPT